MITDPNRLLSYKCEGIWSLQGLLDNLKLWSEMSYKGYAERPVIFCSLDQIPIYEKMWRDVLLIPYKRFEL